MNIRTASRTRIAATAAVLAGLTLTLAGCGSAADGDYFHEYGKLTVDGSSVTYFRFDCSESSNEAVVNEESDATGTLNDESTSIMWASDDEHVGMEAVGGTMTFSAQEFGDQTRIMISGEDDEFTFTPGEEEAALATYSDGRCD